MPTRRPRIAGGENSAIYSGTRLEALPTPIPLMVRPIYIRFKFLLAHVCMKLPARKIVPVMMSGIRRPYRSARGRVKRAPKKQPPWNTLTTLDDILLAAVVDSPVMPNSFLKDVNEIVDPRVFVKSVFRCYETIAHSPITPLSYPNVTAPKLARSAYKYVRKLYTSFGVGLSSMIFRVILG